MIDVLYMPMDTNPLN